MSSATMPTITSTVDVPIMTSQQGEIESCASLWANLERTRSTFSRNGYACLFIHGRSWSRIMSEYNRFTLLDKKCIYPFILAISYNQPHFYDGSCWNPNATTVLTAGSFASLPLNIFISRNDTIYVSDTTPSVGSWIQGSTTRIRNISGGTGFFVTANGDVYVNHPSNPEVNKWSINATSSNRIMWIGDNCRGLFVSVNNSLYCSLVTLNQVVSRSVDNPADRFRLVAGTGCSGPGLDMLSAPVGIFVDPNFTLLVADSNNNRVQRFEYGVLNGSTAAGNGATGTIALSVPTSVVLDGAGYLFIVDSGNNRIVGSDSRGFRCVAGCTNTTGSAANQLTAPKSMSFDSSGNIWVADAGNTRIQRFTLESPSFCGK